MSRGTLSITAGAAVWLLAACTVTGTATIPPPPGVIVMPPPEQPARLDIPKGHYPPPGSCRIWIPGVPPGQQSPPGDCARLRQQVRPGAVLVQG